MEPEERLASQDEVQDIKFAFYGVTDWVHEGHGIYSAISGNWHMTVGRGIDEDDQVGYFFVCLNAVTHTVAKMDPQISELCYKHISELFKNKNQHKN